MGASGMEVRRWLPGEREGGCGGGGYGDSGPLFTHRTLRCAPQPLNTRRMLLSSHFYPTTCTHIFCYTVMVKVSIIIFDLLLSLY